MPPNGLSMWAGAQGHSNDLIGASGSHSGVSKDLLQEIERKGGLALKMPKETYSPAGRYIQAFEMRGHKEWKDPIEHARLLMTICLDPNKARAKRLFIQASKLIPDNIERPHLDVADRGYHQLHFKAIRAMLRSLVTIILSNTTMDNRRAIEKSIIQRSKGELVTFNAEEELKNAIDSQVEVPSLATEEAITIICLLREQPQMLADLNARMAFIKATKELSTIVSACETPTEQKADDQETSEPDHLVVSLEKKVEVLLATASIIGVYYKNDFPEKELTGQNAVRERLVQAQGELFIAKGRMQMIENDKSPSAEIARIALREKISVLGNIIALLLRSVVS